MFINWIRRGCPIAANRAAMRLASWVEIGADSDPHCDTQARSVSGSRRTSLGIAATSIQIEVRRSSMDRELLIQQVILMYWSSQEQASPPSGGELRRPTTGAAAVTRWRPCAPSKK